MEGGGVYDDSRMSNVLLKNGSVRWAPNSSPSFHGSATMVSFEDVHGENTTEKPVFTQTDPKSESFDDEFDGRFHPPEKKRRLSPDQVKYLEKNFEVENKLEPERKNQLAKETGLQPRQVAIWFQNRRARYKTKVLEKEYDALKEAYDKLKLDYDNLCKDNEKMKNEVNLLTEKLLGREPCDLISPPSILQAKKAFFEQDPAANVSPDVDCKHEDGASSAKSDVLDSDSPRCTDGNHSAMLEPTADSSHAFDSDFSQDEDDSFSRNLLPSLCLPKLGTDCYDDLQPNSCNLGFPVQDHGTWSWLY